MTVGSEGKSDSTGDDPAIIERMIELEMAQKRRVWKETVARNKRLRVASFLFLFLVIVAAGFGGFVLVSTINQKRAEQGPRPASAASKP